MISNPKIALVGGGTAGHVSPNLALIPALSKEGFSIIYIGRKEGIEKDLCFDAGLKYYGIETGKLRRYFDIKNFSDPFRVIKGISEAKSILKNEKPDIIFSKGGFVAVPVVLAAHKLKIPIISHESDYTPGLANKISQPYSKKICVSFEETLKTIKPEKSVFTGLPVRESLLKGEAEKGRTFLGFKNNKPIILSIGGSSGSEFLNKILRENLEELTKKYNIVHCCGKGRVDSSIINSSYVQYEYLKDELADVLAVCDIVISRAGANAIFEFLSCKLPSLLIPLSKKASRGDQILNATSFVKKGYGEMLEEEEYSKEAYISKIENLYTNKKSYIKALNESRESQAISNIVELIKKEIK